MPQDAEAGNETGGCSCEHPAAFPSSLSEPCDRPLDPQEGVLPRDGVTASVAVSHGAGFPCLGREYLPVALQLHAVVIEPLLDHQPELPQLPLVRPEDREVVHVAQIMRYAVAALADHVVERLQGGVGEPLRGVGSDEDAVPHHAPDQVEDAPVFHELPHAIHHDLRLQALVEVPNVEGHAVAGAFRVFLHPPLYRCLAVVGATASDASGGVLVHASHHDRLEDADQGVVDVLVGPLDRL